MSAICGCLCWDGVRRRRVGGSLRQPHLVLGGSMPVSFSPHPRGRGEGTEQADKTGTT